MKNLNSPLPSHQLPASQDKMPALHTVPGLETGASHSVDDLCSVMGDIPPSMAPVQSHAVLEYSLGHSIPLAPRTPATARKVESPGWSPAKSPHPLPPVPPKRSASRVGDLGRPANLNLPAQDHSIYSRPRLMPDRSSLMSTGSSDSGTGSSSEPDQQLSPGTLSQFSYQDTASMYSEANTSMTSHSGLYVKMRPRKVFSGEGAEYMNFLYSAVQRQGGAGTVESAMSPYLAMTAANTNTRDHYASISSTISNLYDKIDSTRGSFPQLTRQSSREEVERFRALEQFQQLMTEVETKRQFRVGLNLFNTIPDVGIDYLVKAEIIELKPLSVAKFLYKNQSLAKAKIGEYLGQFESAFCMKVLSLFVQEFDFSGLRIDKAIRKLVTYIKVPGNHDRVEKIMEAFVKRYVKCNPGQLGKTESLDRLVVTACSIVKLNIELHSKNNKKISEKDFLSSLSRHEVDSKLLKNVYKSVKKKCLESEEDHVSQTAQLQQSLLPSSAPDLAAPHRRLVCLCSLLQLKSEMKGHPRVVWLFNDILVIVKPTGKGGLNIYKENIPLLGMEVSLFKSGSYKYGVELVRKSSKEVMATLCLETEQDQYKLVMDLQESIFEMETMRRAAQEANMIK